MGRRRQQDCARECRADRAQCPDHRVGGDAWNKQTAERLEREYQTAKPKLDAIAGCCGRRHGAGRHPGSWDGLSGSAQEVAESKYEEDEFQSMLESEQNYWSENDAEDGAKALVAYSPLKWRRSRLLVDVQVAPVLTAGM